jgi:hypothetical protein
VLSLSDKAWAQDKALDPWLFPHPSSGPGPDLTDPEVRNGLTRAVTRRLTCWGLRPCVGGKGLEVGGVEKLRVLCQEKGEALRLAAVLRALSSPVMGMRDVALDVYDCLREEPGLKGFVTEDVWEAWERAVR